MIQAFLVRRGSAGLGSLRNLGKFALFFATSVHCSLTPPIKFRRILKQIWFIGWNSLLVICLTGLFTGMVLALQGYTSLKRVGSEAFLGPLVTLSLVRELGPVLCSLMVAGRAGSAITAEIGIMRVQEQIDALELMGLNPFRYLVVPNLLASILSLPVLGMIFNIVGIFGGYLIGVRLLGLNEGTYFNEIRNYLEWNDILGGIYKLVSFGILIAWISCFKGFHASRGADGDSAATTSAVVTTSVAILVWDYFVTSVVF
ncbi:MAG TPA: ABC transporter permease [Verrucomicrobiales bacterium]|nr:ABC transporter permease [Verrucomicrobiales bacterium]